MSYPKSRMKRMLRQQAERPIDDSAVDLVYLDYCLFLQSLLKEANIEAERTGEKKIQPIHIQNVKRKILARYRG
ncbi:hypothetical protein SPOG_05751 [Schizosaccharomyces cryophilus OY26]|uniref:Transcription factor CBF/NF-Y/archaeal histone domain-containing protein n=1 Tax=Schizosaccharomyces cryophilus (strain OY26 / ATCC MYA-4695 / CBS 11777 / NBRC 106824 / NRRL Y48691) TaxID=653667 RepID=S9XDL9_SCHCR|nr:uncharacterized protein SPOG_05751 [Schizosaccharomyces cryophilus OY26]EPY51841.1 hypothetical protein SPOG_05751 [Schizosaccharomyces cryophilus OY26]